MPGRCLLYTSDAADEEDSVDLGGLRLIEKKKKDEQKEETKRRRRTGEDRTGHRGDIRHITQAE